MDALQEDIGTRLQVDDEVRRREIPLQKRRDLVVDMKLPIAQVDIRENPVLLKHIVAHDSFVKEIGLRSLLQLLVPIHEKEHLGLEGVPPGIFVEILEERVSLRLLEDQLGVETLGQKFRQACFSDSDDALDRNVPPRHSP